MGARVLGEDLSLEPSRVRVSDRVGSGVVGKGRSVRNVKRDVLFPEGDVLEEKLATTGCQ